MKKVGDTLKEVLANTWRIPTCGACHETAKRMNELGVVGCRENIDELAEQLHQNAKQQKWSSLIGAAIKFVDAVAGNSLYRKLILDVCDYVEKQNQPCCFRGRQSGHAPFSKSMPRFVCDCPSVRQPFCILCTRSVTDLEKARLDNLAVCSVCEFNYREGVNHG